MRDCQFCKVKVKSNEYQNHIQTKHKGMKLKHQQGYRDPYFINKPIKCQYCKYYFSKTALSRHMRVHSLFYKPNQTMPLDDKSMPVLTTKSEFEAHSNSHTLKECEVCKKRILEPAYKQHFDLHYESCPVCNGKILKNQIGEHNKIHFTYCQTCGNRFLKEEFENHHTFNIRELPSGRNEYRLRFSRMHHTIVI